MKRCPQCEFIYEDDQSHCDMDGAKLTRDSHPLPKLQALTTTSEPVSKSKWRNRIVAVFATFILGGVLALVYYVSVNQNSGRSGTVSTAVETPVTSTEASPASSSNSVTTSQDEKTAISEPASTDSSSSAKEVAPAIRPESKKPEVKPSSKRQGSDRTTKSTPPAQSNNQPRSTATEPPEKDSKVKSVLKKTGRFLKRTLPL